MLRSTAAALVITGLVIVSSSNASCTTYAQVPCGARCIPNSTVCCSPWVDGYCPMNTICEYQNDQTVYACSDGSSIISGYGGDSGSGGAKSQTISIFAVLGVLFTTLDAYF